MNTLQAFFVGLDPDHLPGLLGGGLYALFFPARALYRRLAGRPTPPPPAPISDRIAGHLLNDSAAIHLALPIGHHDNLVLIVLFLASGVVYGALGWRALAGGRYRTPSAILIVATLIAYIHVVAGGGEGTDQVGILTAVVELAALGVCLVPRGHAPVRRAFGSVGFVLAVVVSGAGLWGLSLTSHGTGGGHGDDRGEAGVIMRPVGDQTPTPAQVRAAATLAAETKSALARYADIRTAIAAGYSVSINRTGLRVHLENKAYDHDGRVLDPHRPELLMYAIEDGKATLLSAVYQMPRAGEPGPTPGGSLTRWHAHDVCLTLLPPGYSLISIYGTCPMLSVNLTIGEMMHVWVVDEPGGPFADDASDSWIRSFNATHGIPFSWSSVSREAAH